jgi:hypothetical protein
MDANRQMGRLIMNVMLASGGYTWTMIHGLAALERASVKQVLLSLRYSWLEAIQGKAERI